jgi:hypothetical protein
MKSAVSLVIEIAFYFVGAAVIGFIWGSACGMAIPAVTASWWIYILVLVTGGLLGWGWGICAKQFFNLLDLKS